MNIPRGAVLHIPSSGRKGTLQRPLQHLYPLEVATHFSQPEQCNKEEFVETGSDTGGMQESGEPEQVRPRQAAATIAHGDRLAACSILESDP